MSKTPKERYSLREFWRDRAFFEIPISLKQVLAPENPLNVEEEEYEDEDRPNARYFANPYLTFSFVPDRPGLSITFDLFSGLVHLDGLKLSRGIRLSTMANKLQSKKLEWEIEQERSFADQVGIRVKETSFTFVFDKSKADFLLVDAEANLLDEPN